MDGLHGDRLVNMGGTAGILAASQRRFLSRGMVSNSSWHSHGRSAGSARPWPSSVRYFLSNSLRILFSQLPLIPEAAPYFERCVALDVTGCPRSFSPASKPLFLAGALKLKRGVGVDFGGPDEPVAENTPLRSLSRKKEKSYAP